MHWLLCAAAALGAWGLQTATIGDGGSPEECCVIVAGGGGKTGGSCCIVPLDCQIVSSGGVKIFPVALADGEGNVFSIAVRQDADQERKAWIGVRMAPMPAALEAHLGRGGLMVGNVVEGSPADDAGLRQYDVIATFDGVEIEEMSDLVSAIGEAGAGGRVKVTVIRGAQEQTVTLRPAKWKGRSEFEWKYDEPQDAVVDDSLQFHGLQLSPGPGGRMRLMPLGKLKGLPKGFEQLKGLKGLQDFQFKLDFDPDDFKIDIDVDDLTHGFAWHGLGGDSDAEFEFKIKINEDGNVVTIRRNADGTIEVTREDEDGQESSETYDDADELKEGDAGAYKVYRRFGGRGAGAFMLQIPALRDLPGLQKRFQGQIERRLKTAIELDENLREKLRSLKSKVIVRSGVDDGGDAHSEAVMIMIGDDGGITVKVTTDGETETYEFEDKDAFRAEKPELYKKIKCLMDQDGI